MLDEGCSRYERPRVGNSVRRATAPILLAWSDGLCELVLTSDIHEEYRRVATELQQQFPRVDLAAALDLVLVNAHAFLPAALDGRICTDPDDDRFLACALASGAGIIVSGDKHLLSVSGYRGVDVLRPRAFVERCLAP